MTGGVDPWAVPGEPSPPPAFPTELLDVVVDKLPDRRCCPPDDDMPHRHPCLYDRDTAREILEALREHVELARTGPEPEDLVTTTPSGRIWDASSWLWVEARA